jgi:hypothetical protein
VKPEDMHPCTPKAGDHTFDRTAVESRCLTAVNF